MGRIRVPFVPSWRRGSLGNGSEPTEVMPATERSPLWRFCQFVARIGTTLLFDLKVWGVERVPRTGGVLLVANHQSYLDPVLVGVRLQRPVSYMAKSELFRNRFFAVLIRALHAFPVRQGKGDKGAIEETIRRLHQGYVLNIYPEGSRTEDGTLLPIQRGVALVVRKADVPVVPLVIDGSYDAYPRGHKLFRPYPIRMLFGRPLKTEGLKGDQIVQLIDRTFREMMDELHARARAVDPTWSSAMTRAAGK